MSNGIASIPALGSAPALPHPAAAILLAALFVAVGGCNANTAPPLPPLAATAAPDDQPPSGRQRIDLARNRVWTLTSEGVVLHDAGTPGKTVEVALPSWVWVDVPYSCPPDLALGPKGEAVITSNIVPVLWRIDPDTLAVTLHELVLDADKGKDVGFSGLVYSMEHGEFFAVSDVHGSVWRIDALLSRGRKVPLAAPNHEASCMKPLSRVARNGG
jgi:hypothetical protein